MLVALIIGAYYYRLQSAARQWEGPVAEILSEKLEKDIDTMEVEFTFVPEAKRVAVKTVEHPLSEIHGEYTFVPSPDGQQTLIAYKGTVKDKVKLPVPLALQKSMLRETFVSTMRALQRGVESQRRTAREGQAAEQ